MVFSGLYPTNNNDFENLREALGKLQLNDSSFTYQPEVSAKASASASAAASWACCIARSSSSGWNATATSTWCRRPPTSPTRS